jgi:hypothetical protein
MSESWSIIEWLDQTFCDHEPLFSTSTELAMAKFFDKWFGTQILPLMFRLCVFNTYDQVRAEEQEYFRSTREAMLGRPLASMTRLCLCVRRYGKRST